MKLDHLNLSDLKPCPVNVRKKGAHQIDDLLPSIRAIGLIQPILVRPNCEGFEVVAGQRRYNALTALAAEGVAEPVPCIIMEKGDDAKAIEASLAENFIRLPMDEIDQYKAFAALEAKGMTTAKIASHYGVTERLVKQRLAIAGLLPQILNAYSCEEISGDTVRALTLATKRQQQEWWKLFKSEDDYAPTGRNLKAWLFGGCNIPVSHALFDEADYPKPIISDLFEEERYFSDSAAFWDMQNAAIAAKRDAYQAEGWRVTVLDIGEYWHRWEYEEATKEDGGRVFISCNSKGEVQFHEGYISREDARKRTAASSAEGDGQPKPVRPEITKAMQNYIGLHRHAAVQAELLAKPAVAFRLTVAHLIAGSSLWDVTADPKRADNKDIADSVAAAKASTVIENERAEIRALLGFDETKTATIARIKGDWRERRSLEDIFRALLPLADGAVMRIITFIMAETLAAHSIAVQTLAEQFGTDMRHWWTPDQTFFDLLRDKEAINEMMREVAGDEAANANVTTTAKVQKGIIADCLAGNRTMKAENWLPRYLETAASGYTDRYPSSTVPVAVMVDNEDDEDANAA